MLHFKKNLIFLSVLLLLLIVVSGCSQGSSGSQPLKEEELKVFTLEELAEYDGKDGSKAYIAVDGIVYDVTNEGPWKGGEHNGFTAGRDLTEEIKTVSPHGVSKLKNVPVVGKLE